MKKILERHYSIGVFFGCLAVLLPAASYAETLSFQAVESHYAIFIDGDEAGEAAQRRVTGLSPEPSTLRIDESSQFHFDGDWGEIRLSNVSAFNLTPDGLKSFDHKLAENDANFRIRGEQLNGGLWCSAYQVMTKQEKKQQTEDEMLTDVGVQAVTKAVPYLGTALQLVSLLGAGEEKEGELQIPLQDFDAALREFPLFFQRQNYRIPANQLRLLDTETLEINRYSAEYLGEEELNAAGQIFHCHVVSLKTKKREMTYWIAEDELSAFIVKERGKDDGVAYEIVLESYRENR